MFYRYAKAWHCDCGRRLTPEEEPQGQCDECRKSGVPAPTAKAIELVRAGRILDMRDERWQSACPR